MGAPIRTRLPGRRHSPSPPSTLAYKRRLENCCANLIQLQAIAFESARHQVWSCLKALPILLALAQQALACTSRIVFYSLSSEQSLSKRHFIPCQLKCGWGLLKSWRNWFHRKFESLKTKTGAVALLAINLSWKFGISDRVIPVILWQMI